MSKSFELKQDLLDRCHERDETTPLRVKNVPKMHKVYVRRMSDMFHTLSMFFLSWIMVEWIKAVPASQGINAAFSTGSQAQ